MPSIFQLFHSEKAQVSEEHESPPAPKGPRAIGPHMNRYDATLK